MVVPNFAHILDQAFGLKNAAIKILLALALLLALVAGFFYFQAKTLRLERDLSRATVADLARVIDRVNQDVAKWKAAAELQAKAAESARITADLVRREGERRIAAIKAARVPAACTDAVAWGGFQVLRTLEVSQ